jgi:multidrug efflux system membrane fusion protein
MNIARLAVVPLLAALVLAGCARSQATDTPAAPPAPEVSVAEVISQPLRDWEEFSGRLEAVDSVEIRPRVAGFVDSVHFTEGAHVKKGDLLFRIDPRPFRAEVNRLTAELKRARSQQQLAASNHERGKRLLGQHWISQQDFDQLATAEATGGDTVGAAQAALDAARLNLEFTEVRAPIDGRVSRALITAGNLVSNANVLTTVVSDNPVYAYFDADEHTYLRFANRSKAGADGRRADSPVFMGLIDEHGYPHEGRLNFLDNVVDAQSGTIRGRAVFDNSDGRFTPGLFARIKLVGGESRQTVLIDDRAVGTDLGKKYVLALKPDDTLERRFVELGASLDGLRVVKQGLAAGDVIVVNGLQHARPGTAVKPTRVEMTTNTAVIEQLAPASDRTASTAPASTRAGLN